MSLRALLHWRASDGKIPQNDLGPRNEAPPRAMPCARGIVLHEVLLQLAAHRIGPTDAHADKPRSTAGKRFNGRDADLFCKALGDDESFAQMKVHFAAHSDAPRFAAAIASWALV